MTGFVLLFEKEILLNEILAFSHFKESSDSTFFLTKSSLQKNKTKVYEKRVCLLNEKEQNFDFFGFGVFKKQKDDREEEKGKEKKKKKVQKKNNNQKIKNLVQREKFCFKKVVQQHLKGQKKKIDS